jgi:diketogulonate reductase-like aldo/keto reductase
MANSMIKLNNSSSMPALAFGFWELTAEECAIGLEGAIDEGYRFFDFASIYGNEAACGQALAKVLASGKVKREELFILSKLWASDWHQVDTACTQSLKDLQLDYVDMYLVHSAVGTDEAAGLDTLGRKVRPRVANHVLWQNMEALVAAGKTKGIGVSNWSCLQVADCLNYAKIPPAVIQVEIHPTYSTDELTQWCITEGIAVMGYTTLGTSKPDLTLDPVTKPAKRLGVSPHQVIIRWSVQKGYCPITKVLERPLMKANRSLDFELTADEMSAITALDGGLPMKICDHAEEFGLPLYKSRL